MSDGQKYLGKYRGIVSQNVDPEQRGRLQVVVPDVTGTEDSSWAEPCVPYAGKGVGLFLIPPTKASVWVEFEYGDRDKPIWSGCFWPDQADVPASPAVAETKILKTEQTTITLSDQQGSSGITIETKDGMKIVMNSQAIEITNGKGAAVKLSDNKVSINDTALEVE